MTNNPITIIAPIKDNIAPSKAVKANGEPNLPPNIKLYIDTVNGPKLAIKAKTRIMITVSQFTFGVMNVRQENKGLFHVSQCKGMSMRLDKFWKEHKSSDHDP